MKALLFIAAFSFFLPYAFCQQDVGVDPLTGKLQLGIPLAQVHSGTITVPVALVYNGGGVKVSEAGGTAGVGWNLEAGGQITREIRGLPDEYSATNDTRQGWLITTNRQALTNFSPTTDSGCDDWSAFSQFTALNDTEPDVFYFNAPGLNGKFIFDNDGVIRPLPYQDLKFRRRYTAKQNRLCRRVRL